MPDRAGHGSEQAAPQHGGVAGEAGDQIAGPGVDEEPQIGAHQPDIHVPPEIGDHPFLYPGHENRLEIECATADQRQRQDGHRDQKEHLAVVGAEDFVERRFQQPSRTGGRCRDDPHANQRARDGNEIAAHALLQKPTHEHPGARPGGDPGGQAFAVRTRHARSSDDDARSLLYRVRRQYVMAGRLPWRPEWPCRSSPPRPARRGRPHGRSAVSSWDPNARASEPQSTARTPGHGLTRVGMPEIVQADIFDLGRPHRVPVPELGFAGARACACAGIDRGAARADGATHAVP